MNYPHVCEESKNFTSSSTRRIENWKCNLSRQLSNGSSILNNINDNKTRQSSKEIIIKTNNFDARRRKVKIGKVAF
jgi:hypothetical protein